jgi:hypothetical protein
LADLFAIKNAFSKSSQAVLAVRFVGGLILGTLAKLLLAFLNLLSRSLGSDAHFLCRARSSTSCLRAALTSCHTGCLDTLTAGGHFAQVAEDVSRSPPASPFGGGYMPTCAPRLQTQPQLFLNLG